MKNKNGIIKLLVTIFFTVSSFVFGTDMTPTSMGSCTSETLIPGIEISFTGLGSHDNDNQSKSRTEQWEWNFDYDKNDPWSYDISTTSIDVEWIFSNDGPYNIAVKYYDNDGSDGNIYRFTVNIKSTRRTYYVKDHLGSIRMTIDENGEVVSAQDYHPYGEILRSINNSSVNEKYKFTEKERDTESNYDYFGARYLNSELGRWNSVDPLADKYPGLSPYNYCVNNPLKYIDPNGLYILVFDVFGNYTGEVIDDGNEDYTGQVVNSNEEVTLTFEFIDQSDAKSIASTRDKNGNLVTDYNQLKKNGDDIVYYGVDLDFGNTVDQRVADALNESPGPNLFASSAWIEMESQVGGTLDFVSSSFQGALNKKLGLIDGKAYNNFDAGNYCLGYAMSQFGLTAEQAKLAAQVFEIYYNKRFDHSTDQTSIGNGANRWRK